MSLENLLAISSTVLTLVAIIVALFANYYSNKNNKQQLRVKNLEELFEVIQSLSKFYNRFKNLYCFVLVLRDPTNKDIQTRNQYFAERDKYISENEWEQINRYLSRIEVLTACYTDGALKSKLLNYEKLMYSFADFIFNSGNFQHELYWKNGYPNFDEFYLILKDLKEDIVSEIKGE
ncbi:hypothetical protein IDJ77_01645 [Mucilaginibacter sp. ZT4R22]|uniref:Uncharacterized protein n=1 Tax=Mucilaginibacter pankratovii TaxID=2772110 RepID=A0ABR7WJK3_9SPHI|nr:hypothetical protein [Mucilaginibacter pankratovii]MBD1362501.1 hypothetical protein [Mucilaginibacter pankratovii]